jgi:hypothetical protein
MRYLWRNCGPIIMTPLLCWLIDMSDLCSVVHGGVRTMTARLKKSSSLFLELARKWNFLTPAEEYLSVAFATCI